jgi:hypothetical protein
VPVIAIVGADPLGRCRDAGWAGFARPGAGRCRSFPLALGTRRSCTIAGCRWRFGGISGARA